MEIGKQISSWLEQAGIELENAIRETATGTAVDAGALLYLERKLNSAWQYLEDSADVALALFIPLFIRDLFANLFVQTPPYDDILTAQRDILATVAENLVDMAIARDEHEEAKLFSCLSAIADEYRRDIAELNALLERSGQHESA